MSTARDAVTTNGFAAVTGRLIVGDCLDVLPLLPDESIDLIHTSPPYNIGKQYKNAPDDRALLEYRHFLSDVFRQCYRVLRPNGSLFFQTGYSEDDGTTREIVPIDMLTYDIFREPAVFTKTQLKDSGV